MNLINLKIKKTSSIFVIFCLILITIIPVFLVISSEVKANPLSETLVPNNYFTCDFHTVHHYDSKVTSVSGNPGLPSVAYWETNKTFLYWGNATGTSDTSTDWGIGKGVWGVTNPIGISPYWTLNVTYWIAKIAFLSPTWTEIGTYSLSTSDIYCSANLGIGYTVGSGITLAHTQMHSSNFQDSFWSLGGSSSTDQPPNTWNRPETGSSVWTIALNTLHNRPFTLAEVTKLVVILEIQFNKEIFYNIGNKQSGSALSIAIGGVSVTATPVDYTPPDLTQGFILRPESDYTNSGFKHGNYSTIGIFDSVNETNPDYETTYIYTNWTDQNTVYQYASFNMTNPPNDAREDRYTAYLWLIMKCDYQDYNAYIDCGFVIYQQPLTYQFMGISGISETWANYTSFYIPMFTGGLVPYSAEPGPFSLSDLTNLITSIKLNSYVNSTDDYNSYMGSVDITQLAVICIPYSQEEIIEVSFEKDMFALIWFLIIYLPAIAIGQFVPRFGFILGMALMLGIIAITELGFAHVALMGYIAMIVSFYKGG